VDWPTAASGRAAAAAASPAAPHPAQAVTWSILRMTVLARFAAAAAVSAALWTFIWLAMK